MGIVIREANVAADRDLLLGILLRNRDHGDNELRKLRFEWSYFQNPFGQPRAWLAIDPSCSHAVGMVAVFPRPVKVNGSVVQAWNGGDTSIDKEYRTLGVALKLRRAVKSCVDRNETAFLYSFPVDRMRVVLERIGHRVIGRFARHGVVLRTDTLVQRMLGRNSMARLVAGVTNTLPPLQWCYRAGDPSLRVRLQSGNTFGNEYDDLYQRVAQRHPVLTVRSSEFLHWRFNTNPLVKEFRVFRLEREATLQGYAIVGFEKSAARILDIQIDGDQLAIRTLLLGLIRQLRVNGISTLALRATDNSAILAEARPLGFWFQDRRDAGISVYTADENLAETVLDEKKWFLTQADRDV